MQSPTQSVRYRSKTLSLLSGVAAAALTIVPPAKARPRSLR
jgi:hypothetical protein